MKNSNFRKITALSALVFFAGAMQPASASTISAAKSVKPPAPTVVLVTENAPTVKAKNEKKVANVVVFINTNGPVPDGTRILVTVKGGHSCKIETPAFSCTISKIKIGKTLIITAKSKFAGSGYGPKSAKFPYLVTGVATPTP